MKILILDIETAPFAAYIWKMFKENISPDQLISESYILSFAAKWHDSDEVIYADSRHKRNKENDKHLLVKLRRLMDKADIIIAHNGGEFDIPVINARLLFHRMTAPSSFRLIDTLKIVRARFRLPFYKLAYLTDRFNKKYKKLDHKKFPGFKLWLHTVFHNDIEAWKEMEIYNKYDVLSLEELYFETLITWDNVTNFFVYQAAQDECRCGSNDYVRNGIYRTPTRQYQRYRCNACGYEWRSTKCLNSARFTNVARF